MKLSKISRVRMIGGMFAALFAILMILSAASPAAAQGANAPTLAVGDSAYFGGIMDIGEEYKAEMEEALQEFEEMGFDVSFDANGGAGAYFGWEVISNSADVNGVMCYDIALMGAVAVDFGIEADVDGSITEEYYSMSVDGKGDATLKFEATLEGHLYLSLSELAVAKLQLTVKADGDFRADIDASMSAEGMNMDMTGKATASADDVQFDLTVTFNPPIDIYDFPINQGDEWYVPAEDTAVEGTASAKGTVTYDVEATVPGEEPIDESETLNLATEMGTETISETIEGGQPEYFYGESWGGGTLFRCTSLIGNNAVIEMDMFGMMEEMDIPFPGTRQFDFLDPTSMMPEMGMQIDTAKGMMTGFVMDGVVMTEATTEAVVEDFIEAPLKTVTAETGGAGGSMGSLMMILVVVIVIVVVVVVVVMVVMRKKTPPPQQYPPQQPMYGPQPGYEQPPPQYPPPPQPDQYGNYPPPPPPPGQ